MTNAASDVRTIFTNILTLSVGSVSSTLGTHLESLMLEYPVASTKEQEKILRQIAFGLDLIYSALQNREYGFADYEKLDESERVLALLDELEQRQKQNEVGVMKDV
jgi:hypothetical protein